MNGKHLLTSDEKIKNWGYGEWVEEPDIVEFEHEGFKCRIVRCFANELSGHLFGGHLCGYVCVPKENPKHGKDVFEEFDGIDVHGGLTYGRFEDEEYWIGFDCAHSGDICPSAEVFNKIMILPKFLKELEVKLNTSYNFNGSYKNIGFVIEECKRLAEQLLKIYIQDIYKFFMLRSKQKGKYMNIEDKEYVADERMQIFFKKLLELKEFVKQQAEDSDNSTLNEIYNKLDKIIKETGK